MTRTVTLHSYEYAREHNTNNDVVRFVRELRLRPYGRTTRMRVYFPTPSSLARFFRAVQS